eukprot:6551431-Alexandrium_andersonii.AAC.1
MQDVHPPQSCARRTSWEVPLGAERRAGAAEALGRPRPAGPGAGGGLPTVFLGARVGAALP